MIRSTSSLTSALSYSRSVSHSEALEATLDAAWNLLVDWGGIIRWMPDGFIQSLTLEGQGEGAIRHLVTGQGVRISERLDSMNRQQGILRLSIIEPLPWGMLSYSAHAQLKAVDQERCRLDWCGTFELPGEGTQADQLAALLKRSYATLFQGIRQVLSKEQGGTHGQSN